jgi:hypothetical protein
MIITHRHTTISSPAWGRIEVEEASEGSFRSCAGFPLPNPPTCRERGSQGPA